jgi:hypothetical protein
MTDQYGALALPAGAGNDGRIGSALTGLARVIALQMGATLAIPSTAIAEDRPEGLTFGVEIGAQWVAEDKAFWLLSDTFAVGTPFESSPNWGEGYVKPYLTFSTELDNGMTVFSGASFIASGTLGTDVFDQTDDSEVLLEELFAGIEVPLAGNGSLDLSLGSQLYEIGTGMLISGGSGNGFERGALIFGPRKAWEITALIGYSDPATSVQAFYLDPRELQSNDTDTTLAGLTATHSFSDAISLGAMGGVVLTSEAPWVQAAPDGIGAPEIILDGRDGMRFANIWGSWALSPQVTLSGDLAYETNDSPDMEAWGGRLMGTYSVPDLPFQPVFGYSVQRFSGDDPSTPELERFDPLFYDGSPAGWGSGANASLVFLNSNITAQQLFVSLTVSDRDFLTFRYFNIRANELLSPLQFGQGTRLVVNGTANLISGVTDAHLADDLYVEYTRIISPTTFLTAGASVSVPGDGIVDLRGGQEDIWTGGYVNIVMRF